VYPSHSMNPKAHSSLLRRVARLAEVAVPGTLVESRLRCGKPSCACRRDPDRKHGPYLYLKYTPRGGRPTGIYVPRSHEEEVRSAVEAWAELREALRELGEGNREELHRRIRRRKGTAKGRRAGR